MIVVMQLGATQAEADAVIERLHELGLQENVSAGVERTVIGVVGQVYPELKEQLELLPGVSEVVRVSRPYKLASREFQPVDTLVRVGDVVIGGPEVVVIAGPCAVETEQQVISTAHAVKIAGARLLRGGAFKPRSSPYSFRGLGEEGLRLLAKARDETGLPVVTEVLAPNHVDLVAEYADVLQIGTRNMQNFILLDEVGRTRKPVILKRGLTATIEEWLLAAEYILSQGNRQVILCERGIRTFETYTRNTMDISAIPVMERLSHLPVIADPSHGTGRWHLVSPVALAAVASGADGLLIEVHPDPDHALSDGPQSLTFENFHRMMVALQGIAQAINRPIRAPQALPA